MPRELDRRRLIPDRAATGDLLANWQQPGFVLGILLARCASQRVTAQSPYVYEELVALTGIEPVFKP